MVNRIKQLSDTVLDSHRSKFGMSFADNKKALEEISVIRSKELKNELAGYITKFIKRENSELKRREVLQKAEPEPVSDDGAETFHSVAEMEAASEPEPEESAAEEPA